MCSTVTVFSLSVSRYVGTPPTRRSATSTAACTLGRVLSSSGSTTRKRHQASQKQNSTVAVPATRARRRSRTGPTCLLQGSAGCCMTLLERRVLGFHGGSPGVWCSWLVVVNPVSYTHLRAHETDSY